MNFTVLGSSIPSGANGFVILMDLWRYHGGLYGDYYILIYAANLGLLPILQKRKWLGPSLQQHLQVWLFSTPKFELDGIAFWATQSVQMHHQYLVLFCLVGAARQRFKGSWMASPESQNRWYCVFLRILLRACIYIQLFAICRQYDRIPRYQLPLCCMIIALSSTYEVFQPWLASVQSPRTVTKQIKKVAEEFDEQASRSLLTTASVSWPSDFPTVTHPRLADFQGRLKPSGTFVSSTLLDKVPSPPGDNQCRSCWVDGSSLLTFAMAVLKLLALFELAMAKDVVLFWKLAVGSLFFTGFVYMSFQSLPGLVIEMGRLVHIIADPDSEKAVVWWTEQDSWLFETRHFLNLLVSSGFPFKYQFTLLGPRQFVFLWHLLSRLEGLELAIYVCIAAGFKYAMDLLLYELALLIRYVGLGEYARSVCSRLGTILIRMIVSWDMAPGFSSIAVDLLNAERALAALRVCKTRRQCITTLRVDNVVMRLEDIVAQKGEIQEPCAFFSCPRPTDENLQLPREDHFQRRAIALGLMRCARVSLENLRRAKMKETKKGLRDLQSLMRLLVMYTIDSEIPDSQTSKSITAVAELVQKLVMESAAHHWAKYKKNREDNLEAELCMCLSEKDWLIMVVQLNVSMLLAYTGLRSASLYWPYEHYDCEALKEWATDRLTISSNATECCFV